MIYSDIVSYHSLINVVRASRNKMITRKKFLKAMEEVDLILQQKDVKIYARSFHAVGELAKLLDIKEDIPIVDRKDAPQIFTPEFIATHIHNWYEKRYGERLKTHMGPGSIAILIKGTPWEVRLPLIYGSVRFVCDTNLSYYRELPEHPGRFP